MSERTLHSVLSVCSVLEILFPDNNTGHNRLHISALTLRSLGVSDTCKWRKEEGRLEEVIRYNAPLLEKLIPRNVKNDGMVIQVIRAPKLKTPGYVSAKIATLELGTIVFKVPADT